MEVYVNAPSFSFRRVFTFQAGSTVRNLLEGFVFEQDVYVVANGRLRDSDDLLQHGSVYHLEPRLRGGKGGFGSMLRALGAQIEKTTNREACRDLSGRRLRDVNHEKEMAEWLKKQAEREAEKEQRRAERLQRKLSEPKHLFADPQYQQQCHDLSERLEESVLKGLQASSSTQVKVHDVTAAKRSTSERDEGPAKKKKSAAAPDCFWTGVGELLSSEEEEDEDDDEESPSGCRGAGVAVTTQGGDGAEPVSSSSCSPIRPPEDRAARPSQTPGDSAAGPSQTAKGHAAGPLETPVDHAAGPSQTPGDSAAGPSQTAKGHAAGPLETPGDHAAVPSPTPKDGAAGPSQTPGAVDSAESNSLCLQELPASQQELEALGLDVLKRELACRGLKCGGTLSERAARLLAVRTLRPEQIDPLLLAKPPKSRRK